MYDNSGALFRDDRKAKETDRDYSGSITIAGVEYWLSAWVKTSPKTGRRFLSISAKPKVEKPEGAARNLNDEVAF
jgi:hypothetical protein